MDHMEPPVHIFREEPPSTCSPGPCLLPSSSSWLLGWAEYGNNASGGFEDLQQNHTNISPAIPIIITAVYSVVFVVGLVGNSLVMFVIISIFTLTMMSVDRYIAVCHPVKALDFRTPLKAKIINICIWLLSSSVGISAIVLGGTKVREDTASTECSLQFPDSDYMWWDIFMKICVFVFAFVIPVLIIIVCYTLMILRLKSVRLLSGSREKDRNLRRITRLVLVVVAVFIICWTPIHIFVLVEALGDVPHSTAAISSYYFCIALGYTNSSLNPILYAFLDENFKRCFKDFCFPFKMRMDRQSTSRVRNTVQDPAYMREVDGTNKPV
ncbi:Kappa-type opioid receptor [Chelonia mydas]|uniref:Kappa-type opioid receptor n=1 Tax=Chelonia mydas TaxID=8469 RepID=M7BI88_CHEMY|nr:Kappa-type opioid receptor [Chelonia mydas]